MFLKNITVNKYRSIQHARADFENGLNIIIGKNGVGKSNLLKYIDENVDFSALVAFSKQLRTTNLSFDYTLCYNDKDEKLNDLTVNFRREGKIVDGEVEFTSRVTLSRKEINAPTPAVKHFDLPIGTLPWFDEKEYELLEQLEVIKALKRQHIAFELPKEPKWLARSMKYELDSEFRLGFDSNIESSDFNLLSQLQSTLELAFFTRPEHANQLRNNETLTKKYITDEIIKHFNEIISSYDLVDFLATYSPIESIRLNPNINIYTTDNKILIENLIIEFRVNNSWVPWSYLSDGTKRLFYLITQCLGVTDGIVLIEEPELGVHPHQLHSLMQFIYEQSRHKQIIISTHSPIVLDVLSPDDLHRITIAKLTPTGSQFYKLTEEQKDKAKEYMEKVGELSYYWLHSDLEDE